ncbi:MAG: prephenate dehydratase [Desulfobacteraceae bacterium]|jgi:prephenate dehydratase
MKVAFQGIKGAYSEQAAYRYFGRNIETVSHDSFDEAFEAVITKTVDYGVIPVENTIAGSVVENFDLMLAYPIIIVGEVYQPICHCLLASKKTSLESIKRAFSHPHALKQCKDFLKAHDIFAQPLYDTAGAARQVAEWNRADCAAIASELCAEIYDMSILESHIQSNGSNTTRFFIIVADDIVPENKQTEKTTIAFAIKHAPGALVDALKIFQKYRLNLTRLESRPIPENPWEYVFYTDFEGGLHEPATKEALAELQAQTAFVKILGSYVKGNKHG